MTTRARVEGQALRDQQVLVCSHARDADDARQLLEMFGLLPYELAGDPGWTRNAVGRSQRRGRAR